MQSNKMCTCSINMFPGWCRPLVVAVILIAGWHCEKGSSSSTANCNNNVSFERTSRLISNIRDLPCSSTPWNVLPSTIHVTLEFCIRFWYLGFITADTILTAANALIYMFSYASWLSPLIVIPWTLNIEFEREYSIASTERLMMLPPFRGRILNLVVILESELFFIVMALKTQSCSLSVRTSLGTTTVVYSSRVSKGIPIIYIMLLCNIIRRLLSPVINFFDCDNLLSAHFKTDRKIFTSEIHSESSCSVSNKLAGERDRKSSELKIFIAFCAINSNAPVVSLAIEKNFAWP